MVFYILSVKVDYVTILYKLQAVLASIDIGNETFCITGREDVLGKKAEMVL